MLESDLFEKDEDVDVGDIWFIEDERFRIDIIQHGHGERAFDEPHNYGRFYWEVTIYDEDHDYPSTEDYADKLKDAMKASLEAARGMLSMTPDQVREYIVTSREMAALAGKMFH